jgi:hypothetical protein
MARLPRFLISEIPLHLIQRGNNRQVIFADDEDFGYFRHCLLDASRGEFGRIATGEVAAQQVTACAPAQLVPAQAVGEACIGAVNVDLRQAPAAGLRAAPSFTSCSLWVSVMVESCRRRAH